MKIVIYSDDKDFIKTAEGITRDPPVVVLTDYDAVVAALEQGEDALLFLDYDTDKKIAKKINEHFTNCLAVKRVLISGKLSVRDFKKMQKKDYSCDGYYQKPLDQKALQGIIDDYELIFQMNADDGTEVAPSEGEETKIGRMLFGNLGKAGDEAGAKQEEGAASPTETSGAAENSAPEAKTEAAAEEKKDDAPAAANDAAAGDDKGDLVLDLNGEEEPAPAEMDFTAAAQTGPTEAASKDSDVAPAVSLDLTQEETANEDDSVGIDAALAQGKGEEAASDAAHTAVIGQNELAKLKAAQAEQQAPEPAAADAGNLELEVQANEAQGDNSFVAEVAEEGSLPSVNFDIEENSEAAAAPAAAAETPAADLPATEVELNDGLALDEGAAAANVDAELKVDEDASQADYPNLPDDIDFNQDGDASGAIDIDAELAQSAAEGEYDNFSANDETVSAGDAALEMSDAEDSNLEEELDIDPLAEEDAALAASEEAGAMDVAPTELDHDVVGGGSIPDVTEENFSIDPTSYAKLQGTIRHLREERNSFLEKISKLESERQQALSDKLGVEAELEELKIELSIIKKRNADEVQEYKFRARSAEEKKEVFSQKNRTMQRELESLRQQVRVDVNKIKERERQLEGQLELAQMDAAGQIEGRDQKILELKRKIDALEFNMENMAYQQQKAKEDKSKLQDKMNKMMAALRGSIRLMEEDMEVDQVLTEQFHKRAG